MNRREFLAVAAGAAAGPRTIERGGWRLALDANGNIVSLRSGPLELVHASRRENRPRVSGPASIESSTELIDLGSAVAVKQTVTVLGKQGARAQVTVDVPRCIRLPDEDCVAFLPRADGVADRQAAARLAAAYTVAGEHGMDGATRLAIPLVSESSPKAGLRIAYCTDVFFSTGFGETFRWIYSDHAPLPDRDRREIYTILSKGGERDAIGLFYKTGQRSVAKGPDWLHDIALVDYDYLSDNGKGWYRDIDVLAKAIPQADRHQALFCLHGWYGYIGRYTYDQRTDSLAKEWVAMPESRAPAVQALADKYNPKNPYSWRPEAIHALQPVPMNLAEMHRRLRYAKDRAFRVALYYGDGIAACKGLKEIYEPSKVLRWGGWTLPDTLGEYYVQNPLHPEVFSFFQGYMQALLNEYARDVDAFVWDETFLVTSKDLGNQQYPGYAARAMMRLVESLSITVQQHNPQLAFMTSDNLELKKHDVPCALVAHGNYQDSAMFPGAWDYCLFPNFRNVTWSCNWGPIRLLPRTRYAAEVFDAPVSISNGYGEDLGVSEMSRDQLQKVMDLFDERKRRRMDLTWIENRDAELTYKGRKVNPRPVDVG